jgi:DNA polymerase-3 subunit epsilon
VIDTLRLVRRLQRHRLAVEPVEAAVPGVLAAARTELGLPPHEPHDAFSDAVATAELLLVLAHRLGARTVGDLL